MKLKKKSGLIGAVIALSAASLVSVGFASWVISAGVTQDVAGVIEVDNVENAIHTIDASSGFLTARNGTVDASKNKIVFGCTQAAINNTTGWLKNDGTLGDTSDSSLEVLTVWYKVVVNNVKSGDTVGSVIQSAIIDGNAAFDAAVTAGYVAAEPNVQYVVNNADATASTPLVLDGTNAAIVLEYTFHWGTKTNGGDPFTFWNAKTVTVGDTTGDYATAALRAQAAQEYFAGLEAALASAAYTLTITTK